DADLNVGRSSETFHERGRQAHVHLDGEEATRGAGETVGQRSVAGADLDDEVARRRRQHGHDALCHAVVAEEVLAERACLARAGMPPGRRREGTRIPGRAHAPGLALSSARRDSYTALTCRSVSTRSPELSMT